MRITLFHLFCVALVLMVNSQQSLACSCVAQESNPIPAYEEQPVVFVGTVTSIQEDTAKINRFGNVSEERIGLTAYLRVDEPMKGVTVKEVTIFTGGGGGDCGFPFKVGESYLVFANPTDGRANEKIIAMTTTNGTASSAKKIVGQPLATSICSFTRGARYGQEDIDILRDYIAGNPRSRLSGTVRLLSEPFNGNVDLEGLGPVKGIQFNIRSATKSFDVITDTSGSFLLRDVPPGHYRITAQLAPYYENHWSWEKSSLEVDIADAEDNYRFSMDVHTVGDISGTLVGPDGRSVGEQVEVQLIPAEFATNPRGHHRSEYTSAEGRFRFDGLPEGKYLLGIAIGEPATKNTPYPTVFYPNSKTASGAKVIEIKKGDRVKDLAFVLPQRLARVPISGQVVDSAGRPVRDADIRLLDSIAPHKYIFGFDDFKTDATGHFRAFGLAGNSYLLHVYKDSDYLAGEGKQATPIQITLSKPMTNLHLVLDKNGIFLNQLDPKSF